MGVEGCSSGTNSSNLVWWLSELSSGSPFDSGESKLKKRPCMLAGGDNLEIHDYYENGGAGGCGGGGGCADGEKGEMLMAKKGPWTAEEDERLKKCVEEHGIGNWITIEKYSGLGRTSKSCRLRWTNHLRPNLKKGSFSKEEERVVIKLHQKYGNKWSYISSKLPGRTDNEIKNFWHGRVRRCRRKFLPIYPENIDDDGPCRDGLDIDGKHSVNDDHHNSAATDDTNSIPSVHITMPEFQPPLSHCIPSQRQPTTIIDQNPALVFTPLPQSKLFSPHQPPFSSPQGVSSSHYPSPACYPTQIPQSLLSAPFQTEYCSIQQFQSTEDPDITLLNSLLSLHQDCLLIQQSNSNSHQLKESSSLLSPSPSLTQFLAPGQEPSISATGSSTSSPKLNVSSPLPASQFSSTATGSLKSPKLHISVQLPTASDVQLQVSSLHSAPSCNQKSPILNDLVTVSPHSHLHLNLTSSIPPGSFLRGNPCEASSLVSSYLWNSPKSEPPSVQTPTSALRPVPDMKTNQFDTESEESIVVLDAPVPEALANADALYKNSPEELSVDRCLINNDVNGKILATETIGDNVFYQSSMEGGFFSEKPRTMILLGQSLQQDYAREMPKTRDLINKRSCRKVSHDKCLKPETSGKISRRRGLLSEISKTGVLLVESEKKQILLRELLNEGSKQEVLASQNSKKVDLQLGRISKTTKLFGERVRTDALLNQISKTKGSGGQNSEEGVSKFENMTNLMNQNIVDNMPDTISKRSISLTLEDQMCNPDAFSLPYSPKDVTTQLSSDSLLGILNSPQVVAGEACDEISREVAPFASQGQDHELGTRGPVVSHSHEVILSIIDDDKGGNLAYGESYEGLDKMLWEKCPDFLKGEFMEDQFQSGQFVGGGFISEGFVVSEDLQEILQGSIWDLDKHMAINMLRPPTPDGKLNSPQSSGGDLLEEALSIEGSSSRSLENGVSLDQSSREILLGESSSERVIASREVTLTEFVSPSSKDAVADLLTSSRHYTEVGFSQCYEASGVKLKQEKEVYGIGCEASNIMDMTFELEVYHLHPIMRENINEITLLETS